MSSDPKNFESKSGFSPGDSKSGMESFQSKVNIGQRHIAKKMSFFLDLTGEKFPAWALGGLCNAYAFLMFRAAYLGMRDQYLQRLTFIAEANLEEIRKMAYLYRAYITRHKITTQKYQAEIESKLNPIYEKLSPIKKQYLELKRELDEKKGSTDKLAEVVMMREQLESELREARTPIFEKIEKEVEAYFGPDLPLMKIAKEFYFFIQSSLALFDPGDYLKLRKQEEKESVLSTRDYLKFLKWLPPDALLKGEKEYPELYFSLPFTFTESELKDTFQKVIPEGDLILLESPTHLMFLTFKNEKYSLDDPSAEEVPLGKDLNTIISDVKSAFFENKTKKEAYLPIDIMIFGPSSPKNLRINARKWLAEILDKRGSDNHINEQGYQNTTALWLAANAGDKEITEELLRRGADPNIPDDEGTTPIIRAALSGYYDITELLIQASADPNVTNHSGDTAMGVAAYHGHSEIIRLLVERKADPNKANLEGDNPIYRAISRNHPQTLTTLAESKADLDFRASHGTTPSLFAIKEGDFSSLKILAQYKANLNLRDDSGHSPLSFAIEYKRYDMLLFLLDQGANFDFMMQHMPNTIVRFLLNLVELSYVTPSFEKAFAKHHPKLLQHVIQLLKEDENREKILADVINQKNALGIIFRNEINTNLFGKKVPTLYELEQFFKSQPSPPQPDSSSTPSKKD